MDVSSIDGDSHRFCCCYVYGFASGFLDWCRCGWSLWKWIWSFFGSSLLWKPVPLWIWTWSCLIANYFPAFPYLNLVYLNSLSKTLHPLSYSSNLLVLKQCEPWSHYCYSCGKIGHYAPDCVKIPHAESPWAVNKIGPYGPWLSHLPQLVDRI